MNARRNRWLMAWVAATALGAMACDPYAAPNNSKPEIVRVLAYNSDHATGQDPLFVETPAGGPYVVPQVNIGTYGSSALFGTSFPGKWVGVGFIVQFNKPMNPLSIQSAPTINPDGTANANPCVPAANLTITPPVAVGVSERYITCYSPSNPDVTAGSELLLYRTSSVSTSSQFADPRRSRFPPGVDYRITGTVTDQSGASVALDATFKVVAEPPAAPSFAPTTGSVVVTWPDALGAVSYDVQRAPDVTGAPGTWSTPATAVAATTYTDAVAAGNYWYRLVANGGNATTSVGTEGGPVTVP